MDVYEQLKVGAELLKTLSKRVNIKEMENIKEIEQSCRDEMNEIALIMTQEAASNEDELMQELERLTNTVEPEAPQPIHTQEILPITTEKEVLPGTISESDMEKSVTRKLVISS